MDLSQLIDELTENGTLTDQVNNPLTQFRAGNTNLLGATILPERVVEDNMYREENLRFKTFAAVPSTRYSPVTVFEGALASSFSVELGESDMGLTLDAKEFDLMRRRLAAGSLEQATSTLLNFALQINAGLQIRNEIWRWQALINSQITAKHGKVQFTVDFADPAGHRVTIPSGTVAAKAGWYSPDYDPIPDILGMIDFLESKGYLVNRIITSRSRLSLLSRHPKVQQRLGGLIYVANGTTLEAQLQAGRVTSGQVVGLLRDEGLALPNGIEINDAKYNTRTKTLRYMPEDAMVFLCTTGRDEQYAETVGEDEAPLIVPDTLGYLGVGTAAGQDSAGRVVHLRSILNTKPPRTEGEGWQTSGPVILEPEAIGVLRIPAPTP